MSIRERLKLALIEFVERASKKDATEKEVEALPVVASVLAVITSHERGLEVPGYIPMEVILKAVRSTIGGTAEEG